MEKPGKKYIELFEALKRDQTQWRANWREVQEFLLPRRGNFIAEGALPGDGERRHGDILDATGSYALRVLAAGMQGGLASPARPWFRLTLPDLRLSKTRAVKQWLEQVQKLFYTVLAKSNFYNVLHASFLELGGYGQACLLQEESENLVTRFRMITCGEYYWAANDDEQVDTVCRLFSLTARQIDQWFGKQRASRAVREALAHNQPFERFKVLHVYQPRKGREAARDDKDNWPFESVYVELEGDQNILQRGGYQEAAYLCSRWESCGQDVYGRPPADDVLPTIKSLQDVTTTTLMAQHKMVDPPINVPVSYQGRVNLLPGGVNYYDGASPDIIKPMYQVNPDINGARATIADMRQQIREGFYNDLFMMILQHPNMTATEVLERKQEKMTLLGPVVERQQNELFNPMFDRLFAILDRRGLIPPWPEALAGMEIIPDYISVLAQAQKAAGATAIDNQTNYILSTARVSPPILDVFDLEAAAKERHEMLGAPASLIRPDEEIEQIRATRAQAQAQAAQRAAVSRDIADAQALGRANAGPDTALGALLGGQAPQSGQPGEEGGE